LAGGGGAQRRRNRKTLPFCLPRLPGEVARSAGGTGRRHLFASPACRGRWREAPEEPEDATFLPPPLAGGGGAKRRRGPEDATFLPPPLAGGGGAKRRRGRPYGFPASRAGGSFSASSARSLASSRRASASAVESASSRRKASGASAA